MYELFKPWLFRQDPETIHERVMHGLAWLGQRGPTLELMRRLCAVQDERLAVTAFGLRFPNPIGLAAGFDKNAVAVRAWAALGFGHVEIGSVTALPQPGNDKPRLFRLPQDQALINRMGFNNEGAEAIATRLKHLQQTFGKLPVPIGINLGKSKATPLEEAPKDYLQSLSILWPYGDYFVVNVSSPNTPGLRALQDKDRLEELLAALVGFVQGRKPLLLKIAPDLGWAQIDEILALAEQYRLSGLIATNTTTSRAGLTTLTDEAGGLSGKPLRARSLEVLRYLHTRLQGRLPIISVGGIFSAADVWERLAGGATLVQVYTGFVYEGPFMVKKLCRGLLQRLEQEGMSRLQELKPR
ncbi:quinone-dependent dihydroorotate dehydrogenase [Meiothermus hypogaeus]|uniref:Dihydroorotate dehydrogenase (quinone) n=2 Tax=Meiothermus hypogaeus TaxID=884155 RepID=A0A511R515_9DEIN|nr:quinone-dependent dihydroorotate dehydrogenase [Meiothermus hypogaeus]RIH75562.1 Dihydroorotate dehydrogenase (quinone) [Meiothermus hypogaeus]GEM84699.1 dihydroorotate dehydrogenase (quinone) [Meiothermus hypogaeus NBRC 106114]